MGPSILSDLLGWTSIGCWLFAQFPQVLENVRNQSCEGLALPFLFNWLLGDITNLVGCVLTHQLPFQTILASYFVWVDFMLFSQYFYYGSFLRQKRMEDPQPEPSPVERHRTRPSRTRTYSTDLDRHHYRELSTAAANLAIAAAMAATNENLAQRAKSPTSTLGGRKYTERQHRRSSTSITRSEAAEAEDEVDEDALAALADSINSDGGKKRLSWSQERHGAGRGVSASRTRTGKRTISPFTTIRTPLHVETHEAQSVVEAATAASRGRARQRQVIESPIDVINLEDQLEINHAHTVSQSSNRDRRSSRASQRSVGLVFLGVWALFSVGSSTNSLSLRTSSLVPRGMVLTNVNTPSVSMVELPPASARLELLGDSQAPVLFTSGSDSEPSSERIVGRIFAWLCTTLYLTSRLPQIWKNFRRKSVEGLSMYLFVFAFLGNMFYVLSILASPLMSEDFLLESTPYLLGSGGTFMFDVTIVAQSFIYRSRSRRPRPAHSRLTSYANNNKDQLGSSTAIPEDERPLLTGDVEPGHHSEDTLRQEHLDARARRRRDTNTAEGETPLP